jgi:hypothetical protein
MTPTNVGSLSLSSLQHIKATAAAASLLIVAGNFKKIQLSRLQDSFGRAGQKTNHSCPESILDML